MPDLKVEQVVPRDASQAEEWIRVTDEKDILGVEAVRASGAAS
jgi:hypothetical protein